MSTAPRPIRTIEQGFGFGKNPQSDVYTPNSQGQIIRLSKLNPDIAFPQLATEDDSQEMGKNDEFAVNQFATSWSTGGSIRKYLTSQIAQWAYSFALGGVAAADAYTSTMTPQDPVIDGIELPYFSVLQQFRATQVGGAPLDQLIIGCSITDLQLEINGSAGRQATTITVNYQGIGKFIEPSGYTMPDASSEKQLQSASASVIINGINYIANANRGNLNMLRTGVSNGIDSASRFFIGSGTQTNGDYTSGAIGGRLEYQNRQYPLTMEVRLSKTSAEFAALRSLQTGSALIALAGGPQDGFNIQYPKVSFESVVLSDTNNIAVLQISCRIFKDPSLGPIVVSAQNSTIAGLGQAG